MLGIAEPMISWPAFLYPLAITIKCIMQSTLGFLVTVPEFHEITWACDLVMKCRQQYVVHSNHWPSRILHSESGHTIDLCIGFPFLSTSLTPSLPCIHKHAILHQPSSFENERVHVLPRKYMETGEMTSRASFIFGTFGKHLSSTLASYFC